jgi:hypothetical protein
MTTKDLKISIFLLGLGFILLVPHYAQAQIHYGIRAGLNATNISFKNLPERSERLGFHAGVFADVPVVSDFLSIQPELSYSIKGTSFKFLNEHQNLKLDYLDFLLPVAFKLGVVSIQVGPYASYLLSTPNYKVYNDNLIIKDAYNKIDAGLTAGLSYNFNKLLLGIRYNQGFVNVNKDNTQILLGSGKNSVGQVSLGYRF